MQNHVDTAESCGDEQQCNINAESCGDDNGVLNSEFKSVVILFHYDKSKAIPV